VSSSWQQRADESMRWPEITRGLGVLGVDGPLTVAYPGGPAKAPTSEREPAQPQVTATGSGALKIFTHVRGQV